MRPRSTTDEGNDEAWEDNEAAEDWTEAAAVEIHACDGEPVRRATWWKSRRVRSPPLPALLTTHRLLLLTYVTGVQVWETREGFEGAIDELLNLRETDVVLCARLVACPASLGSSKDPLLALVYVSPLSNTMRAHSSQHLPFTRSDHLHAQALLTRQAFGCPDDGAADPSLRSTGERAGHRRGASRRLSLRRATLCSLGLRISSFHSPLLNRD